MRRCLTFAFLFATTLAAQVAPPIDAATRRGTCLLAGGGKLPPEIFARFLALAGGAQAKVVLIPTASETADDAKENADTLQLYRERLPGAEVTLLHTRDRAVADDEVFCTPLARATGVWITGGAQDRLASAYLGTRFEKELLAVLARGGVIGGTSAGTAIQTRTMIQEGMDPPIMATGFDFVPGAISDQHFLKRRRLPRLLRALAMRPGHFGIGVDEGTAAVVHGNGLEVIGASKIVLVLAAAGGCGDLTIELQPGATADLDGWRLAARQRIVQALPSSLGPAKIEAGTLVLAGGSDANCAAATFAGSLVDKAAPVLVVRSSTTLGSSFIKALRENGCSDVQIVDLETGRPSPSDWAAGMAKASGVWLTGIDARTILEAFEPEAMRTALCGVLARGGAIGGEFWAANSLGELVTESAGGGASADPSLPFRGLALLPGNVIGVPAADVPRGCRLLRLRPSAVAIVRGDELRVVAGTIEWSHPKSRVDVEVEVSELESGARYDLITGERR
jgi:cyanophycinase